MPPLVARSAALSLYRQYLRTAARMPKLRVRVSTRRAVRMAFRARAYDYLAAAAGDGGVAVAEAAAEVWIRDGREDLGTFCLFGFSMCSGWWGGEGAVAPTFLSSAARWSLCLSGIDGGGLGGGTLTSRC